MTLPALTVSQRREALGKAQEMRSERKRVREKLKKGSLTLKEALNKADDEILAKMRVAYLLASLPRVGKTTARRIMDEIGIDNSRRVRGLGKRQREALLERFGVRS